jgi:spore germination protein KC
MVGKLNQNEAMLFSLMTTSKNTRIEIEDPLDKRFKVLGIVKKTKSSMTKVTLNKGKPQININLKLNIDVKAVQSDNDYDDPEKSAKLEAAYENYLKKGLTDLFNKTTKEFKSDIFGFSERAKRNFKTIDKWEKAKWQEKFPNSEYKLNVDVKIRRQS